MRFLMTLFVVFSAMTAHADIVFAPGISYSTHKEETTAGTGESKDITYDLRLGYLHPSGLYLGGMYSKLTVDDFDGSSFAATIGFQHYSGFMALFHYHLMAEMDRTATTTMTDGMGPQIDIGWVFPITYMFSVGPQITYRSINYKKLDNGSGTSETDITRSDIMPYLTLWFKF